MSQSTPPSRGDSPAHPQLRTTTRRVEYDGRRCGIYGYVGTEKVFIQYTIRHRKEDAFPISVDLFHRLDTDVTQIFVVDKDTNDVYRFPCEAYESARRICREGAESYAPDPETDHTGYWADAKHEIIDAYPHW